MEAEFIASKTVFDTLSKFTSDKRWDIVPKFATGDLFSNKPIGMTIYAPFGDYVVIDKFKVRQYSAVATITIKGKEKSTVGEFYKLHLKLDNESNIPIIRELFTVLNIRYFKEQ